MTGKYVPLREEITVVETLRFMPEKQSDIKKLHKELAAKYGPDVVIERRDFTEQEWSWRTDTHYDVEKTEYLVKCMRPVYSEADQRAINKESMDEHIARFTAKYARPKVVSAPISQSRVQKILNDVAVTKNLIVRSVHISAELDALLQKEALQKGILESDLIVEYLLAGMNSVAAGKTDTAV